MDARARKRVLGASSRPVSAFAPGMAAARSEVLPSTPLSADELGFVAALRAAGITAELDELELARAARHVHAVDRAARRIDLLAAYYETDDPLVAQRRRATDRWFLFGADEGLDASALLGRVLTVVPELAGSELERVGGADGTLVLRAGEDVCALEDELELEPGIITVSVCDLVRAVNVLLDRRLVRARLVGLIGDGGREAYLGLPSATAAIGLSSGDYLAAADAEALLDLTGW
ncbi:MAG: hypothetical protein ABW252_12410 [Polyangiales bacterium]